jgi:hypothetical protein
METSKHDACRRAGEFIKRHRAAEHECEYDDAVPQMGRYIRASSGLVCGNGVGSAERGQRREEEPPFRLDQFELDSYFDPDCLKVHRSTNQKLAQAGTSGYVENYKCVAQQIRLGRIGNEPRGPGQI